MFSESIKTEIESAIDAWKPGSKLVQWSKLEGGISAQPYLLQVSQPNGEQSQVIARFLGEYAKSLGAETAAWQFNILKLVREAGLPSPEALYMPSDSEEPWFLMSYLPGVPTANPPDGEEFIKQFAAQLARIHQTPFTDRLRELLPKPTYPWAPWRTEFNGELREAEVVDSLLNFDRKGTNQNVLRHGDFWPGNVLCQEGKITGIIDWEECCQGDPLADLAISRLDIWWILGREASERFTDHYLELNPIDSHDLVYWDLRTCLRPMANLEEWAGSYASLGRPDISYSGMKRDLVEFTDLALKAAKS